MTRVFAFRPRPVQRGLRPTLESEHASLCVRRVNWGRRGRVGEVIARGGEVIGPATWQAPVTSVDVDAIVSVDCPSLGRVAILQQGHLARARCCGREGVDQAFPDARVVPLHALREVSDALCSKSTQLKAHRSPTREGAYFWIVSVSAHVEISGETSGAMCV